MPRVPLHPSRAKVLWLASLLLGSPACSCAKDSASPAVAPVAATTLYAWSDSFLSVDGVVLADHTWVTTFDAPYACPPGTAYWYSWGGCHATGPGTEAKLLGKAPAALEVASCICRPDDKNYRFEVDNPAHGGIDFYGIHGVCHQLANRILFATAAEGVGPVTVSDAHAYRVSRFVYGTYGRNATDWAKRRTRCKALAKPLVDFRGDPVAMEFDADLDAMLGKFLDPEALQSRAATILRIRGRFQVRKSELDEALISGSMTPREFASEVNRAVMQQLGAVAESIGRVQYEKLFGITIDEQIAIVDPNIAALSDYKPR